MANALNMNADKFTATKTEKKAAEVEVAKERPELQAM